MYELMGYFGIPLWLVNVEFHCIYVWLMFGWISDQFGFQTAKGNFSTEGHWIESGQESGQKLAGLSAGLLGKFLNP